MMSLFADKDAEIIKAFNSTSRDLDDLLNMIIPILTVWSNKFYPLELQLNKANSSDTKATLLDLQL